MTVCIAAIASNIENPTIVAATDKMVTAGVTTFEMSQGKRFTLGPKIVAYGAGDSSDGLLISRRALEKIEAEGVAGVGKAAELFAEAYREVRREVFERELLAPFDLTLDEFNLRQRQLDPKIVERIDRYIRENYLPSTNTEFGGQTIIAGVDTESGPSPDWVSAHIYVVNDPGQISCEDDIGFAAIGEGAEPAEAYLMLDQYSPDRSFSHAALAVYGAKRRAENAPSVGPATDLMRISSNGTGFATDDELDGFESIYLQRLTGEKEAAEEANKEVVAYLAGMRTTSQAPIQTQPTADDEATPQSEHSGEAPPGALEAASE